LTFISNKKENISLNDDVLAVRLPQINTFTSEKRFCELFFAEKTDLQGADLYLAKSNNSNLWPEIQLESSNFKVRKA